MKPLLLGAAFLGLMVLPAQADLLEIRGAVRINGTGMLQVMGTIGVGTIEVLTMSPILLSGTLTGLGPLTWQNMGQTIALSDLGTNSDLACGKDCLFTLGPAEFHVNSINSVQGDINQTFIIAGIGTMTVPGFESATYGFGFLAHSRVFGSPETDRLEFGWGTPTPGPILGAGLPGLLLTALGLFGWRRRRNGGTLSARLS